MELTFPPLSNVCGYEGQPDQSCVIFKNLRRTKNIVEMPFLLHRNINYTILCTCICQTRQLCTDFVVSCKIFEHSAVHVDPVIEFIQLRSSPFKDSTILAPKLAKRCFWRKSNSAPSKSGSGLPDPDQLIYCTV